MSNITHDLCDFTPSHFKSYCNVNLDGRKKRLSYFRILDFQIVNIRRGQRQMRNMIIVELYTIY